MASIPCAACGGDRFDVEVERASSGLDLEGLRDEILSWVSNYPAEGGDVFFRTTGRLKAAGVRTSELAAFIAAGLEERRRLFVQWCRRSLPGRLGPGERLCPRCGTRHVVRPNPWGRAGFCSRVCWRTDSLKR